MESFELVALTDIKPDPQQPRRFFDETKLNDLAESIRVNDVLEPIKVRVNPDGDTKYMIIFGERRWRASGIAGKETVPAVIVTDTIDLRKIRAQQLAENLDREDLNPVEKAESLQQRIDELKAEGVTNAIEVLSQELGKSPSWVSKNTQILKYTEEVRALVHKGAIRDYGLLKKIDSLKGDKRTEALEKLNSGDFNGKEFFARKRYDKKEAKPVTNDQVSQAKQEDEVKGKAVTAKNKFKIELDSKHLVKLFDKCDFRFILDKNDPDWKSAPPPILKVHLDTFIQWLQDE